MVRVGLARTAPAYAGLTPPFGPGCERPFRPHDGWVGHIEGTRDS
jgi:hypothetical protein